MKETSDMFSGILQGSEIEMHLGDSRKLSWINDEYIDYIIMSPAYWDMEYYGPEPEQIGTSSNTYEEFLEKLKDIFKECFRVLKRGKFISVLVNDFRKDGKFYTYHCDTIRLLNEVGFISHDIRVYLVGTLSTIFASELEAQKRSAKTHEYIIVMRKPDDILLINFKKKNSENFSNSNFPSENLEENVYDEPKIVKYVDKNNLSQCGTEDSLNYYKRK